MHERHACGSRRPCSRAVGILTHFIALAQDLSLASGFVIRACLGVDMDLATNDVWPVRGPNTRIRIERDVVVIQSIGQTTVADLQLIFHAYAEVRREYGIVLALYDSRFGHGMTADARKELLVAKTQPMRTADVSAAFGASFAIRALVSMLERASKLLHRKRLGAAMFATEAEARAYLDQQRILLRSKLQ